MDVATEGEDIKKRDLKSSRCHTTTGGKAAAGRTGRYKRLLEAA